MTTASKMTRKDVSLQRLNHLRTVAPEHRAAALDDWLQIATPGEVRRYWRPWMGKKPGWAN